MMNTDFVYLKVINGDLHTFFNRTALKNAHILEEDCMKVPMSDYPGSAYIDDNGNIVLGTNPDMDKRRKLSRLKQYLAETDYVVIKIAEGVSTKEDYADILRKRQKVREQIHELEVNK